MAGARRTTHVTRRRRSPRRIEAIMRAGRLAERAAFC
jgi:hypothetical protein